MKPNDRLRHRILFVGLAASFAAAGWVSVEDADPVPVANSAVKRKPAEPAEPAAAAGAESKSELSGNFEQLGKRVVSMEFGDMFPNRSWEPPPPPPVKPPPPRAPSLPFTFFGRMVENGKTVVFLSQRDQTFAVSSGDTVSGSYRVEEIGPDVLTLIYLPLNERQTLNIGAIN
jgi:hypothetical protein